jgi:hypothetical protein
MSDFLNSANGFVFLLISFFADSVELFDFVLSVGFLLKRLFKTSIFIAQHINFSLKFINNFLTVFDIILTVDETFFVLGMDLILLVGQELNLFGEFFGFDL